MWVVRKGGDDGELRPWHYIYVARKPKLTSEGPCVRRARKVGVRLPGKANSNPQSARPVHLIITTI